MCAGGGGHAHPHYGLAAPPQPPLHHRHHHRGHRHRHHRMLVFACTVVEVCLCAGGRCGEASCGVEWSGVVVVCGVVVYGGTCLGSAKVLRMSMKVLGPRGPRTVFYIEYRRICRGRASEVISQPPSRRPSNYLSPFEVEEEVEREREERGDRREERGERRAERVRGGSEGRQVIVEEREGEGGRKRTERDGERREEGYAGRGAREL